MTLTIIQYHSQFLYTIVSIMHYLYLSKLDDFSRFSKLLMVYIWMIYTKFDVYFTYVYTQFNIYSFCDLAVISIKPRCKLHIELSR